MTDRITEFFQPIGIDPGARLALRLETIFHRDRMGVEPLTPEAIRTILDEYAREMRLRRESR